MEDETEVPTLTGYGFHRSEHDPDSAALRLDTDQGQVWLIVDAKGLRLLSEGCAKFADELQRRN